MSVDATQTKLTREILAKMVELVNHQDPFAGRAGQFEIVKPEAHMEFGEFNLRPTDVVFSYDYVLDDLNDDERDSCHYWIFEIAMNDLMRLMTMCDYTMVADHDGSGGGLIYGFAAFRQQSEVANDEY